MKNYEFMVYRQTVFKVEAANVTDAKQKIINQLVESGQMKPSSPIIIEEIIDGEFTEKTKEETEETPEQLAE